MFWTRKVKDKDYLEVKKDLESLRIRFEGLQIEFELIVRKLKVKYKIAKGEDTESIKDSVLLPETEGGIKYNK